MISVVPRDELENKVPTVYTFKCTKCKCADIIGINTGFVAWDDSFKEKFTHYDSLLFKSKKTQSSNSKPSPTEILNDVFKNINNLNQ
jgi:hypothetical protein